MLENIHLYQDEPLALQESLNSQTVAAMNRLLSRADFFICGNERQHDFWIGALAANRQREPTFDGKRSRSQSADRCRCSWIPGA